MRRSLLVRVIAGIVGVVAGFSGPALALSHGVAHARYSATAREIERQSGRPSAEAEVAAASTGVVESTSSAAQYYEPICQQCAERTGAVKLALPDPTEVTTASAPRVVASASGPRTELLESSTEFLPDQPRAPPQLS